MTHPVRSAVFCTSLTLAAVAMAPTAFAGKEDAPGQNRGPTIVDIALEAAGGDPAEFTTLTAALVCEDLVDVLDGNRQFTAFAPTDEAFTNLGLTSTNVCDVDGLSNILLYHVAHGNREAVDVLSSDQIRMVNGDFTYPSLDPDNIPFINDSQIVDPDNFASNGVIHIINAVLLPPVE